MLLACVLAVSQGTRADDFLQNPDNYTCTQLGMDKIQFSLPTQMWSSFLNEGVSDGRLYVTVDGGIRQTLLKWWAPDYNTIDTDKKIHAYQKGVFYLTGKTKNKSKSSFTMDDGDVTYRIDGNSDDDDHYTTTVEWQLPREYRGHRLKFEVWTHSEDRDYNYYLPKGNKDATSFHTIATIDTPRGWRGFHYDERAYAGSGKLARERNHDQLQLHGEQDFLGHALLYGCRDGRTAEQGTAHGHQGGLCLSSRQPALERHPDQGPRDGCHHQGNCRAVPHRH